MHNLKRNACTIQPERMHNDLRSACTFPAAYAEDAADVFEYLKEPMVNCFACMKVHSLEEARKAVMERAEDTEYTFAIVLKDTDKVIGEVDAHPESSQPDMAENYVKDTFSPCWMLNPDYHGKGYAYEAAKAFFDYLFYQKGARRIYAYGDCSRSAS